MNEQLTSRANGTDGYKKKQPKNKYIRFVLDPFQIFCIEKRQEFHNRNPELKSSEITYQLGVVWRSLSPEEKELYRRISLQLQNNTCAVKRKKKLFESMSLKGQKQSRQPIEGSEPDSEGEVNLTVPSIYIVPRGKTGDDISAVSLNLITKFQKHPHE